MTEPRVSDPSNRPDRAYLIHASDKESYAIAKTAFRIGRDPTNHLQVMDSKVSRNHAEIRWEGDAHVVNPIGQGITLVNDQPISAPRKLYEGDRIAIADQLLVYTRRSPSGAIVTEAGWADDIKMAEASTMTEKKKYVPTERETNTRKLLLIVGIIVALGLIAWLVPQIFEAGRRSTAP